MDSFFLNGLILGFLIRHCKLEELSVSSLPSTAIYPHDGEVTLPQEPELSPREVAQAVAPPSLMEVEQAVQEASEQAEGRGAEEVLKELLERVVEAALGEAVGGGGVEKRGGEAWEDSREQAMGAEIGESEPEHGAEAKVGVEEAVVVESRGVAMEGVVGQKKEQEEIGESESEPEATRGEEEEEEEEEEGEGEEMGLGLGEEETVAEPVEEKAGGDVGGAEEGTSPVESIVSQRGVVATAGALEEAGEKGMLKEVASVQTVEEEVGEPKREETDEAPAAVEVTEDRATGWNSEGDASLRLMEEDVERNGDVGVTEEAGMKEEGSEVEGGVIAVPHLPPDNNEEADSTESAIGQQIEEAEPEVISENEKDGEKRAEEQATLIVNSVEDVVEARDRGALEGAGGEGLLEKDIGEGLVEQGPKAAGREQNALEPSQTSQEEDQEPEHDATGGAETSVEHRHEDQAAPTLVGETSSIDTGGEELLQEEANQILSLDDLLSHDPTVAQPAADDFVDQVLATAPQTEGAEQGETNELVEDAADNSDLAELGLEAWKIGAISAAVFLVLETIVIIIYMVKCRNGTNRASAPQRACEEGCVEPEAATGGDCNDDTLPAGNGDVQLIAALNPSDVANVLAQHKGQQHEEQEVAMSDLPPGSAEEPASSGPEPEANSSPDLRTSVL